MVRSIGSGLLLVICATTILPMGCAGWGDDDVSSDENPQPSTPSSFPSVFTPMNVDGNEVLFFAADDGARGNEL